MGKNIDRKLENDPLLAKLYEDYLLCRETQFFSFRRPTGRKDGSEKIVTVLWPTGFSMLPNQGGLEDQSYFTMKIFAAFRRGEEQGQIRAMMRN